MADDKQVQAAVLNEPETLPTPEAAPDAGPLSIDLDRRSQAGFEIVLGGKKKFFNFRYDVPLNRMVRYQNTLVDLQKKDDKNDTDLESMARLHEDAFADCSDAPAKVAALLTPIDKGNIVTMWLNEMYETVKVASPLPEASSD